MQPNAHPTPSKVRRAEDSPLLVFDFSGDDGRPQRTCFAHPAEIVSAHSVDEVLHALRAVERAVSLGRYAAGYVAYEAAQAFDAALVTRRDAAMPLLWFGIFDRPVEIDDTPERDGAYRLSDWKPSTSRSDYDRHVETVRERIARGDTYQVNYTIRFRADFAGDPLAFYRSLHAAQRPRYGAYLDTGRHQVVSVSPELFFRRRATHITTRPMKGTIRRGRWCAEDDALAAWLAASEKNRAENVMIVDLLRNDLGRIAETGSVSVQSLFDIEPNPSVFQMTSTVNAALRADTSLEQIFTALFPCGSVTGAPKVSTMRLISTLEDSPRNVYCGALGMIAPQGEAVFSVAIRTVVLDSRTGRAECGAGGGITWNSTTLEEYAEVLDKVSFLAERPAPFHLLETLRLEQGNYFLSAEHLARLAASARYFDVPHDDARARQSLDEHAKLFPDELRRVRLLVSLAGEVSVESEPLETRPRSLPNVRLAQTPVAKHERFLFHKTTRRDIYDRRRAPYPEAFDVLLWNEEGELTEFTNGNLVVELDGQRWTPPVECGLLAGTFRADLLRREMLGVRALTRADLARATRVWLINSVRGWVEVSFQSDASQ